MEIHQSKHLKNPNLWKIEQLGHGSFASKYKAYDKTNKREVEN